MTKKRNSIRMGIDPHSKESIAYTVVRYGEIKIDTLKQLTKWLSENKDKYNYEVLTEIINLDDIKDPEIKEMIKFHVNEEGSLVFHTLKTNMKGSAIEKFIDNEHDAQNCLANINNKDFPKNKQGR